jgi:ankyrin repeat protein
MNYIDISDNNDSVSMDKYGTEVSATSSFIPPQMNGGGWSLFGGNGANSNNQLAIKACKEQKFEALSFLIQNDMISDFKAQNPETGQTILHCIAKNYNNIPDIDNVLKKILTNTNVKSFINMKDNQGNTALHIALDNNNQRLCNILINAGADPKIRNNMGKYLTEDDTMRNDIPQFQQNNNDMIMSETSPDMHNITNISSTSPDISNVNNISTSPSVFAPKTKNNQNDNIDNINKINKSNKTDSDYLVNMLLALNKQPANTEYSADMPNTLSNTDMDTTSDLFNTEKFLNEIVASKPTSSSQFGQKSNQMSNQMGNQMSNQMSNQMYNQMNNKMDNKSNNQMYNQKDNQMGNQLNNQMYNQNQEYTATTMKGGSKNKVIQGSRRMNLYSEIEDLIGGWDAEVRTSDRRGNEITEEYRNLKRSNNNRSNAMRDNEDDMEDYRQISRVGSYPKRSKNDDYDTQDSTSRTLSRQFKSQVDKIHERTIEKIKEIMDVDSDIARNYKAVLYRKIKEEHPELGGYERALEMERLATKENLDKIDINKVTQEIKEYLEKKKKERDEQNKNTNTNLSEGSEQNQKESATKKKRVPKKKTDTSSVSVVSESRLSPTSDDY